jgi:hypothetical protein
MDTDNPIIQGLFGPLANDLRTLGVITSILVGIMIVKGGTGRAAFKKLLVLLGCILLIILSFHPAYAGILAAVAATLAMGMLLVGVRSRGRGRNKLPSSE